MTPDYSIIIPAYNEEDRIVPTLERIVEYLSARDGSYEIIVVDDGSRDETRAVVQRVRAAASKCWPGVLQLPGRDADESW
jgi:dolichyl-phosphate beta-glucosyltransferase